MVILRTRNEITDFLMILAWASPFKEMGNNLKCTLYLEFVVIGTQNSEQFIRPLVKDNIRVI